MSKLEEKTIEAPIVYETLNGVNLAVDALIEVWINDIYYTSIVSTPTHLKEAAIGLAITDRITGDPGDISVEVSTGKIRIHTGNPSKPPITGHTRDECGVATITRRAPNGYKTLWSTITAIIRDFSRWTASRRYRVAAHTVALYKPPSESPLVVVHDTSRHTAILKLIGTTYLHNIEFTSSVVVSTGRASSDIVARLAYMGAPVLVTLRGPLHSGVKAALKGGVTLIANVRLPTGRAFRVLTHPERIE